MNYNEIISLVKSEMKPSMGCTEPVAIGLAVSNTCRYLTAPATKIKLKISSNIFKNAYCVKIPNTTEAGIPLATTLGYLLTKQDNDMEIFSGVTYDLVQQAYEMLTHNFVDIEAMSDTRFYIEVTAISENEEVNTLTLDMHDNLVRVVKNGEYIINKEDNAGSDDHTFDILSYTIADLVKIAEEVDVEDLRFLDAAIDMNLIASTEGLTNDYGMKIGKTLKEMMEKNIIPTDLFYYVKMIVAGASDMRMGGGAYSAMTVLGSGNQGFQATLPVIATCQFLKIEHDKTLRALFMAIIITIRMKYKVGRLSPICGATLSGASSSAAITWLLDGTITQIEGAMQNMFSNLSGMMCDGAKDGCAMKLSTCSGEAVIAARLALNGSIASKTDGIVSGRVEDTIANVARLSQEGMKEVDMNIIHIMMSKES